MSAPTAVLRIDTAGTAFGGTPTYTDRTSYLMGGDQYAVTIRRGRGDELSDPEPATCSFYLKNDDGFWTPGSAAAPANWDVGAPVQVQLTANAVTYDRFTGYVDAIEPAWPGGTHAWSVVKVTCSDVMARLGRANPLRSNLLEEMLSDSPSYLYSLGEAVGATSAADVSTNNASPATRVNAATPYTLTFGSDMGMFDPATGVSFGPVNTGSSASVMRVPLANIPTTGAFTLECWVVMPDTAPTGAIPRLLWMWGSSTHTLQLSVHSTGELGFNIADDKIAQTSGSMCDGGLHLVTLVLEATRTTAVLYVDGVQVATDGGVVTFNPPGPDVLDIGGVVGGMTSTGSTFPGAISHVALYPSRLSAERILAHYQAAFGAATERSDLRFARLAEFGGITTSGLPTGVATMGGQVTGGLTALECLHLVGRSEGGPVYATRAGALTMQARTHRYNAAVGLSLASDDVSPEFEVRRDRMELANEVTVTRQAGAQQIVKDSTSQTRHGRFDAGSFEVAVSTDDDALTAAQWRVATRKNPLTRLPSLTVDLYRQTDTTKVAQLLTADVSTKLQVTGLPSQAPSSTFTGFVEGYEESFSANSWAMTFFTSPVTLEDSLFTLDHSTLGKLDSGGVIGF